MLSALVEAPGYADCQLYTLVVAVSNPAASPAEVTQPQVDLD